jgi:hypothetical protein
MYLNILTAFSLSFFQYFYDYLAVFDLSLSSSQQSKKMHANFPPLFTQPQFLFSAIFFSPDLKMEFMIKLRSSSNITKSRLKMTKEPNISPDFVNYEFVLN